LGLRPWTICTSLGFRGHLFGQKQNQRVIFTWTGWVIENRAAVVLQCCDQPLENPDRENLDFY
jgi:hypothetical protein